MEKYKIICIKIEDLKDIELNALPAFNDRYKETKIRTYGGKVYTDFHDLNVPEDDIECESFTVIFIDSLLVYKGKYYLQVYLDSFPHRVIDNQVIDHLADNLIETDEN